MELFRGKELQETFDSKKELIKRYISELSDDDVMSGQDETIMNNMYEKYKIIPVVIGDEIEENRDIKQTKIDKVNPFPRAYGKEYISVDGVEITFAYQFSGDTIILYSRASTFSYSPMPDVELYSGYLTISASETLQMMNKEENKDLLSKRIEHDLNIIKEFAKYGNNDVETFNLSIKPFVSGLLNARKEKIGKFYNISKMLNIPITKSNPKVIEEIKIVRTIVPIVKKEKDVTTEYSISDEVYNDILSMIKHQGSSFEGTPSSVKTLDEENLRDLILSSLNSVFAGQASGECFRKKGKTDICIVHENRAAFIAECKFWGGEKILLSALDQLLSYTTWRDNKLCLIMFSKNKDFFKVIEEIKAILPKVDGCISFKGLDKNEFEYKIKSRSNEGQIMTIRVFTFNLCTE